MDNSKGPVPANEKQRLIALNRYRILDTPPEAEFDRLTELAALICGVPISLISLIDEKRQWFKSKIGLDVPQTSRDIAFCSHAIMHSSIFEVEDALSDERFSNNPLVTSDPNIRFYAGHPLIDSAGYALGTLCVIDREPRKLTDDQRRALRLLADEVMDRIAAHRTKEDIFQFNKLFGMANDLVCVAGMDGFFKKVNPAFTKVLGWDEKFLLSNSFLELIHPNDTQSSQDEMLHLSQGKLTTNFVNRFRTSDGSYKVLEWMATLEPGTGFFFAIGRDVTNEQQKQRELDLSENRFRSFFEHSQGLMCTHDPEGRFLSVNPAGASLVGYTVEEICRMSLFDLVPQRLHTILRKYLNRINRFGEANGLMEVQHKDGSRHIWMYDNVRETDLSGNSYIIGNAVDITSRHQLEIDLQKTKELLEQTNKMARVGGWEMDIATGHITWSDITREIYEVPDDFVPTLDKVFSFYKAGENRNALQRATERAIQDGTPWNLELEVVTSKGRSCWINVRGFAEMEDGKCKRLFGVLQDIDERRKAQLEIIRSRKQLDDVLQSASTVSIISTDTNGLITVFNKGAENLLGYSAGEIIGVHSPAIIHDAEEVMQRGKELTAEYGEPVEGFRVFVHKPELDGSEQREWTYIRKDGSRFRVSLVVTAIRDENEKIIGYLGVAIDISEREKAERALVVEKSRLQAFVEHAPAAVAMLDQEGKYVSVSRRWLEENKLEQTDITGRSHYEVFPNVSREWKDIHARCLEGAVERNHQDCWRPAGWDHDQYLRWEVRPWYQFDGSIGGIMMFTQDITREVLQREELENAKKMAEQASVTKSEFLANMSHEIRTPLNGVIGFTDLVLKTNLSDTQAQYLSIVNQSANALLSIINDILDFSKIEAGKLELDIERCDLYELGSQATDIITYQAQNKGLEVLLNISSDLPRFIWADAVRLKQVLVNLLGNAVKFTQVGEIELKVTELKKNSDHESVFRFEVRDTGIGIRPEKQGKIFEAFSQEDVSTTKKYGGTGLGLSISNKLLGLMGSGLKLASEPGKGSRFYFDIPLRIESGQVESWEGIANISHALIVDDNTNNRLILKQMLLLRNITSDEAENGYEALQLVRTNRQYDVIMMDYHMPNMDGLETIRRIRGELQDRKARQPVILLHSSSDDETILKASQELNIAARLVKPVKIQEMFATLSRLFQLGATPQSLQTGNSVPGHFGKFSALIAEDNPVNMLLAKTILQRISPGVTIYEAGTGTDAVEAFRKYAPDIVYMDVQMPEMNGYDATQAIRSLPQGAAVPILALTAGSVKGEREKCIAAGMNDFLSKPVVEETVVQSLRKWLFKNTSPEQPAITNRTQNEKPHLDTTYALELAGGDRDFLKDLLKLTQSELEKALKSLRMAEAAADFEAIQRIGHKLNGTALTVGASYLSERALALEHLSSSDPAYVANLIVQLAEEMDVVQKLISAALQAD